MKKKVYFKTFGCRTNQFDTQVMIANLQDFELCSSEIDADIIVVNSCTVTNGADSSVRGYIHGAKKRVPHAKIILAGCGSISKGEELFSKKEIFGVIGHSGKEQINQFLNKENSFFDIGDLNHVDSTIVSEFVGKSRAFIKIQEGCDFECSYCIIPQVRGSARSLDEEVILRQIEKLSTNGFGEFILTGTNVGSYGTDKNSSMAQLLKRMSQIRGVRRIRIGSLEPIQITDEFKELLSEPWMAKHLHIALQHTSDEMLKIMNRRNEYKSDLKLFEDLALKGYALGSDFIVAHPYETPSIWDEAMKRVQEIPLTHIHAFTYSKRDNTASAKMPHQVNGDIAKERHRALVEMIKAKNLSFRQKYNTNLSVLIENAKEGIYHGYDQYFNKIEVKSNLDISSEWITLNQVEVGDEKNMAHFE